MIRLLPGNAHTHSDAGIGTKRNELLTGLTQDVIHTDEEVVTLRMDVQDVTHAGCKTADGKVDTTIQPLQWFPVGTKSTLAPGIVTIDAGATQETERQLIIRRQTVLCTEIERSCQTGGTTTLVAQILQIDEVGYLVVVIIYLVVNGRTAVFSYRSIMETIELDRKSVGRERV